MAFKKGQPLSQEIKSKISKALTGIKRPFAKGHPSPMKGRHISEETKKRISLGLKKRVELRCPQCGKIFETQPSRIKRAKNVYCSKECSFVSIKRKKLVGAYWKGKTCSEEKKLKIKISNTGKRHTLETKKKISLSGKGRPAWNNGKKGVSKETSKKMSEAHKLIFGERHPQWRGGISFIPYCPKFNKQLKEIIRERDNRTCQLCGKKETKRKLHIHHIHYDKPNCNPDLISLCMNCHAMTHHNRKYYEDLFTKKLKKRGLIL